jgi:hypothetical protein
MSKKLIAIAAAAALALTGLVATTPASALPVVNNATGAAFVSAEGATSGAGTSADPFLDAVPTSGTVTSTSATTTEVLRMSISSTLKSRPVTVTATAGIKLLDEAGNATNKYTATSGKDTLTLTTTSAGAATFVAYATTTSTGVITVSITDSSTPPVTDVTQVYVKGVAGSAYAIKSVTAPTSVAPEGKGTFVAVLVDAWGNVVETGELAVTVVGGGTGTALVDESSTAGTANKMVWSATTKRHAGILTAGKTAGQIAVSAQLAGDATTDQVAAFGTPVRTYFTVLTTASVAAQVTALTAQVATLTASVTKLTADYNALAAKWNKRVASKTAPKKKVATK